MPRAISVSGGSGGIVAQSDAIRTLAGRFGATGSETLGTVWTLHGYLLNPTLASAALLDPVGAAAFEMQLGEALDGPGGLSWIGARCGVLDVELRGAAAAYEGVDRLRTALGDEIRGALGFAPAVLAGIEAAGHGQGAAGLQHLVTTDPELADTVIDGLALTGAISLGAAVLSDGRGVAVGLGVDTSPTATEPPRGVGDLLTELSERNDDPHHGAVDVRVLRMADGTRRVVVDVTGTKSWTPLPTGDVTSLTTNGRALSGESGAYEQGVLAAMRRAGVRRTDPVLIIGHSEGGMVAVTTARDAVARDEFNVTHVITAGSPIGRTVGQLPRSVQVLALENERDIVPHLDAVANPDDPNVTTAHGDFGDGTVVDDHGLPDSYIPLGREVDSSGQTSLRTFRQGLDPYLRAVSVQTHTFQVVRHYR